MTTVAERRATFAALHQTGCFVLPNPWDAGSAKILESLGFKALASTSAGMAWAQGRPDMQVEIGDVLEHLRVLVGATNLPVNADFENAFAHDPDGVAVNVKRAAETGVAGLSVEDSTRDPANPIYDFELAVDRIAAASSALAGTGVVLTARSEGFLWGRPDLDEAIRRLTAYAEAGADCLYAPGLREEGQIAAVVAAVAPKPVNVLTPGMTTATLQGIGVRRISVGGGLASAAYGELLRVAREISGDGNFSGLQRGASGRELNPLFARD
jgi:2-methylisocitrate lyase-like PEP mutase family enzyme